MSLALCFLSLVIHKAIANTALCENIFRVGGVLLQFLAEVINIETYVMRFVAVFVAPDLDENLVMRHDPPGILHEMIQQAIFGGTQLNQLALQPDFAAVEIDFEPFIDLDDIVHRTTRALGATNDGFDTADHFTRAERLGDVIIGTQLESAYAVILFTLGGEHDDRHIAALADGFEYFEAIDIGHHHIQQNEIGCYIA